MPRYEVTPVTSLGTPMRIDAAHVPHLARLVGEQLQKKRLLVKGKPFHAHHPAEGRLVFTQQLSPTRIHAVRVTYRKDQA